MRTTSLYKRIALITLTLITGCLMVSAYDFESSGIYYNVDGDQAIVTNNGQTKCYGGNVNIPESVTLDGETYTVTAIGDSAFIGSSGLSSVAIPSTVTRIGEYAFAECGITELAIPSSVTEIGAYAFFRSKLFTFTLPEGMTSTSPHMLEECTSLYSVTLPEGLTTIAEHTFDICTMLDDVTLPQGVTTIGNNAFANCFTLKNITFPEGLTTIGDYAFLGSFRHDNYLDPMEIDLPESITDLGKYAFDSSGLTSFTMPHAITSVNEGLFRSCSRLRTIILHDSVTTIGKYAFGGCEFRAFEIPTSVIEIDDYAFIGCSLTSITIPNSVERMGDGVFKGCPYLDSVVIGNSIQHIGDQVFRDSGIKHVTFADNSRLTTIGNGAFEKCQKLESIKIPSSVKYINDNAFKDCFILHEVELGDSIVNIGRQAFRQCQALETFILPNTVTSIGDYSFYNCTALTDFKTNDNLESIGGNAFAKCSSLKYFRIPDKVQEIQYNLFYNCTALQEIVVGKGVNKIWKWVFDECSALENLIMLTTVPPTFEAYSSPSGLTTSTVIYVPNDSIYAQTPKWNELTLKSTYSKSDIKLTGATITGNGDMVLTHATLFRNDGDTLNFEAQDNIIIFTGMLPGENNISVYFMDPLGHEYSIEDVIETNNVQFSNYTSLRINDKLLAPMFTINCDNGFVPDSCGVIFKNNNYRGNVILNYGDSCIIECTPFTKGQPYSHKITPWVAFNGVTYTGETRSIREDCMSDPNVSPTAVDIPASKIITDGEVPNNVYFSFEGKNYAKRLKATGLEPETTYHATCVINSPSGNRTIPFEFTTPPLRMVGTEAATIDQNVVRFKGWSNIVDEETGCGYEWERIGVAGSTMQKAAYSFDGYLANIVNRIAIDVPYRYRPYYKSAAGNVYYGEWKEFSITETPGNYGPIAYLYKNVELTPTTATVRPLVLQGNSAIRVQQLDVSPQQGGDMYSVNFSGQCAPLKLTGLKPSSRYVVIIKIVTEDPIPDNPSSHTVYSGRIGFTTPSYSVDINGDGEVNIADVNSLIDIILGGLDYSDGLSDVNKDGEVNIADINAITDMILSGE